MLFSSVQTDGAAIARQDGSSSGRFLFRRRVAVGVSYPADDPPDRQHHRRYQNRHHRRHAVVNDRNALEQVAEKTRSEEHTSELQSLMRISYAVFSLIK